MSELRTPKNDVLGNLPDRVIDRFRKQSQLDFEIVEFLMKKSREEMVDL